MIIYRWRENPNVLAHLVSEHEIKGFLKKDVVLNPGEAALILRDGKVEDVATQTKLKKIGGGFINWIKRWAGFESGVQLLFLATTPINLDMGVKATSKDYFEMKGMCTIRFQFSPETAAKVINLLDRGSNITRSALIDRFESELMAMVFTNRIAKHTVEEFHGNVEIQKEIEQASLVEVRKTLSLYGLDVIKLFTVWKEGIFDEMKKHHADVKMAEATKNIDHMAHIGDLERKHDYWLKKQEDEWGRRLHGVTAGEKEKDIHFDASLGRDARGFDEGMRQDWSKWELEYEQDQKELELALGAKAKMQEMKLAKMQKETDLRMAETQQDIDYKTRQLAMQTASTERLMEKGLEDGAVDSKAMQEMLRQQTMQKMADRSDEKVKAMAEAEAVRYQLETYKSAEDRERVHEVAMMDESSKLMERSKQHIPHTLIQGGGAHTPVIAPTGGGEKEGTIVCPTCGAPIQAGWKACPACANSLE